MASLKFWSVNPTAFVARNTRLYVPPVPLAGMPAIFPVPLPGTEENETPLGSEPLCFVTVTAGFTGVVVMVKVLECPTQNVGVFGLGKAGSTGGGPAFGSVMATVTCAGVGSDQAVLVLHWYES